MAQGGATARRPRGQGPSGRGGGRRPAAGLLDPGAVVSGGRRPTAGLLEPGAVVTGVDIH